MDVDLKMCVHTILENVNDEFGYFQIFIEAMIKVVCDIVEHLMTQKRTWFIRIWFKKKKKTTHNIFPSCVDSQYFKDNQKSIIYCSINTIFYYYLWLSGSIREKERDSESALWPKGGATT